MQEADVSDKSAVEAWCLNLRAGNFVRIEFAVPLAKSKALYSSGMVKVLHVKVLS